MTENDLVVFDFFRMFSRFECALKATGYLQKRKEPFADWCRFADEIEAMLFADESISESIEYLMAHPPHQQEKQAGGGLKFEPSKKTYPTKGQALVFAVVNSRNNLFHGGKYTSTQLANTERDQTLLKHGLKILDACLRANTKLVDAYKN